MTSHRFAGWLAALLLLGCSDSGAGPGAEPEPGGDERLCPTCVMRAGGETGSFGRLPCDVEREPIAEDDGALGFTPASVRPLLDREIETTLRWHDIAGDPVPGLEEIVPLTLTVRSGDAFRMRLTPKQGVPAELCRDQLEIEAEVTLSAGDGSIAGRFEGVHIEAYSPEYANGGGEADLSTFRGSLDLQLDRDRPHMAALQVQLAFYPEGIRGGFDVYLFHESEQEPGSWQPGGQPLSAPFPADGCGRQSRPIEAEEIAGGRPFSEVIEAVRERIARQNAIAADWDGRAVDLTFALGDTRDHCLGLQSEPVPGEEELLLGASFSGDVVARSSDERLTMQQAMDVELYIDPSGELADMWLTLYGEPVPPEELADRYGLADVDVQDWPCAALRVQNVYGRNELGDFADGELEVGGFECSSHNPEDEYVPEGLEFASWCTQGTCTRPPRRSW